MPDPAISNVPAISIAMTAYNAEAHVEQAIASIQAQSFDDFELLLVDDRSTDDTGAIIARMAAGDARLRVLESEKGRTPALNRTLEAARAPWFAVMDADDIALPDKFEKQMAFLSANPEVGILGTESDCIDGDGALIPNSRLPRPHTHEELIANLQEGINLLHSTIIARTDLVRAVGGYRQSCFAEDYDLFVRLSLVTRMANMPDCLLHYRVHGEQASHRKMVGQTLWASASWLSREEREAGRPDPLDDPAQEPRLGELDRMFGRKGCDAFAHRKIVERILYEPAALAGEGWEALAGHVRLAGSSPSLWRAAARLLRAGYPLRALQLAVLLAKA